MYLEKGPFVFENNSRRNMANLVLRDKKTLENGDIYYGFWYKGK